MVVSQTMSRCYIKRIAGRGASSKSLDAADASYDEFVKMVMSNRTAFNKMTPFESPKVAEDNKGNNPSPSQGGLTRVPTHVRARSSPGAGTDLPPRPPNAGTRSRSFKSVGGIPSSNRLPARPPLRPFAKSSPTSPVRSPLSSRPSSPSLPSVRKPPCGAFSYTSFSPKASCKDSVAQGMPQAACKSSPPVGKFSSVESSRRSSPNNSFLSSSKSSSSSKSHSSNSFSLSPRSRNSPKASRNLHVPARASPKSGDRAISPVLTVAAPEGNACLHSVLPAPPSMPSLPAPKLSSSPKAASIPRRISPVGLSAGGRLPTPKKPPHIHRPNGAPKNTTSAPSRATSPRAPLHSRSFNSHHARTQISAAASRQAPPPHPHRDSRSVSSSRRHAHAPFSLSSSSPGNARRSEPSSLSRGSVPPKPKAKAQAPRTLPAFTGASRFGSTFPTARAGPFHRGS